MRRITILGLAMGALLAILALAAASASAATPETFECVKEAGAHYLKGCTEEGGKGGYALKPGIGNNKEVKGKSGTVTLHVKTWLGDNTVECQKSKLTGKDTVTGLKEVAVTLSKCLALGDKPCNTAGAKSGEVKITGLRGEYGYIEEGLTPKVGIKLESEAHPGDTGELVHFECTSDLNVTVTGGAIGEVKKDVNAFNKESEIDFLPGEYIGEHTYGPFKYSPLVNIPAWADEQAEFHEELEKDLNGELPKLERPIIKTLICGSYIENLLKVECTPEAYAGLEGKFVNKGEDLEVKA
jgi:hypothetical protein